jgi:lipoprotein-releasing system ATP-binding protein
MKVEAKDLSMSFVDGERTIEVFSNLNFTLQSGSSVAIVGESGVGKTTLLSIMGGLEFPTRGELFLNGTAITGLSGDKLSNFRGENVGFVFQFHNLLPEFSALENVMLPLVISGMSRSNARVPASALLEAVGLKERMNHRPGMLSGGEQQRVAIARSLARSPKLLLADEPTGNLDQRTGGQVSDLLLDVCGRSGITLVVVTHSRELASRMQSRLELTQSGMNLNSR